MPLIARTFPFVCLSAILVAACNHPTPPTASAAPVPEYPVIVRLESRNYAITISAGPRCPVYSVSDSAGEMLVDNISLDDLRTTHPELFNLLAPALAPNAAASVQATSAIYADDR